jgi:hypothetical protein
MKHSVPLFVCAMLVLSGCAGLNITPLSQDTYMASKTSAGGVFVSMAALKSEVISAANEFAEKKGKVAVPISAESSPVMPLRNPSFEYQFKLVEKNSPEAKGGALLPAASLVVEKSERVTTTHEKSQDVAAELARLDELRKRGVITEEEFTVLKSRLLDLPRANP